MVLDENKIVNYLNDHVGELITSYELVKITEAFELNDYSVEFDDHYRCRDCTEDFLGNYDNA